MCPKVWSHPDQHYCATLFRYQRELAVKFRDVSSFVCLDDKHRIKIGEPGYPVAAAECGKQVILPHTNTFVVRDHDFTRFSVVPSFTLEVEIPEQFGIVAKFLLALNMLCTWGHLLYNMHSKLMAITQFFCLF